MPIVKRDSTGINPLKSAFVEDLRAGRVVPVISDEMVTNLVMRGRNRLIEGYADWIGYPMSEDRHDLLKVARYRAIIGEEGKALDDSVLRSEFLNYVKNCIYYMGEDDNLDEELLEEAKRDVDTLSASEFAARLDYPRFPAQGQEDPLLNLANLGLPIYLTTSPYTFLEAALLRAGREPQSEFCRWHPNSGTFDIRDEPSREKPLVFHLFGLDKYPESIMLTEDDYLEFLVKVSKYAGTDNDPVPHPVRGAVSGSALVLLGFEIASWSFRVLFAALIKPVTMTHRGVCCLQVVPSDTEKKLLEGYLQRGVKFEVFWGDVQAYTQELNRLLQ